MAKKPGSYSSTIIALKCKPLNKYVVAHAWGYDGKADYRIRHLELTDRPLMVSRSIKTAQKLIDLIPDRLDEMLREGEEDLRDASRDLDREIASGGRYVRYNEERVARCQRRLDELRILASCPISIVEVTSAVTVSEREVP